MSDFQGEWLKNYHFLTLRFTPWRIYLLRQRHQLHYLQNGILFKCLTVFGSSFSYWNKTLYFCRTLLIYFAVLSACLPVVFELWLWCMIIFYCVISPSLVAGDGSAAAVAALPSSVSASCASILLTLQFLHSTVFTLPYRIYQYKL